MSIKIPSGPPATDPAAPIDATGEAEKGAPVEQAADVDPVTRIAADLAAGKISPDQAVDEIIENTMDSKMIEGSSSQMRTELETLLRSMIETDPQLRSLAAGLGTETSD